jgi:hypothetical protein
VIRHYYLLIRTIPRVSTFGTPMQAFSAAFLSVQCSLHGRKHGGHILLVLSAHINAAVMHALCVRKRCKRRRPKASGILVSRRVGSSHAVSGVTFLGLMKWVPASLVLGTAAMYEQLSRSGFEINKLGPDVFVVEGAFGV